MSINEYSSIVISLNVRCRLIDDCMTFECRYNIELINYILCVCACVISNLC